jgi:Flp pilus assembly protein TadD
MDKIVEEGGALTPALLLADEGQFEQKALDLLSKLTKLSAQELAARDHLDVCLAKNSTRTEADHRCRQFSHLPTQSPSSMCCWQA